MSMFGMKASLRKASTPCRTRCTCGEFAKKGTGSSPASAQTTARGGTKARLLVPAHEDKAQWPQHIRKLKLPPAWTDVQYNEDPNSPLQATGKDAKGRTQYVYSTKFRETQSAKKFKRVKSLDKKYDAISLQNDRAMASKDPIIRDHAFVTALIMEMGLRPGSDKDTQAAEKAYGATTLLADHVKSDGKETRLEFTGKKGVHLNLPVTDENIARELRQRAEKGGLLFPNVSAGSLLRYVGKLNGGGFKTKDLRTLKGTRIANELVQSLPAPETKAAYKKAVRNVAEAVSKKLGNTPTIALQSYISPTVFAPWQERLAA
jgi:DNA topoisomerase-1